MARFPIDFFLRREGFRIWIRENGKEPIWERKGRLYRQSEVVRIVNWEELKAAMLEEEDYYDWLVGL